MNVEAIAEANSCKNVLALFLAASLLSACAAGNISGTAQEPKANFKNTIHQERSCGFAESGSYDILQNSDTGATYRVTVRTVVSRDPIVATTEEEKNFVDDRIEMGPGERKLLGCTNSGPVPVTFFRRSVVGEQRL